MVRPLAVLAAASAVATIACAPAVRSDRDDNIPVPKGATWAWDGDVSQGALPEERIFMQRLQREIETAMTARGYRQVDSAGAAIFLMTLDARAGGPPRERANVIVGVGVGFGRPRGFYRPWGFGLYGAPWGFYRPWGWFVPWGYGVGGFGWFDPWGYPMRPGYPPYGGGYYGERRVILELRDRVSGNVAWNATTILDVYDLTPRSPRGARDVAARLLEELP